MPAVVSVSDAINEPRYPSLPAIMGAKRKPHEVLSLADAGIDADAVGAGGCAPRWPSSVFDAAGARATPSRSRMTATRPRRSSPSSSSARWWSDGRHPASSPSSRTAPYSKGSLGLIEEAARLGAALGEPVTRSSGRGRRRPRPPRSAATARASVHVAEGDAFGLSQPVVDALAALQESRSLRYLLFGASIVASDAAGRHRRPPRAPASSSTPSSCTTEGGKLITRRAGLGDSVLAHCGFTDASRRRRRAGRTRTTGRRVGGIAAAPVRPLHARAAPFSTAAKIVGPRAGRPVGRRHRRGRRARRRRPGTRQAGELQRSARSSHTALGGAVARHARRRRRRLVPVLHAGRPDGQDRVAEAATSRSASPARSSTRSACSVAGRSSRSTRMPNAPDLRLRRPRRGRRPARDRPEADRARQGPRLIGPRARRSARRALSPPAPRAAAA